MSFSPTQLEGDSKDYHILYEAAKSVKAVPGLTIEIGVRRGGGTETIISGLLSENVKKTHICVDPYGNIPYREGNAVKHLDYTNDMRIHAHAEIAKFCRTHGVPLLFFPFTDEFFFEVFSEGFPLYDSLSKKVNQYALVHFDGPHHQDPVMKEVLFFHPRAPEGAAFVFDDVEMYDHGFVDSWLKNSGYIVRASSNRKIWYTKVKT